MFRRSVFRQAGIAGNLFPPPLCSNSHTSHRPTRCAGDGRDTRGRKRRLNAHKLMTRHLRPLFSLRPFALPLIPSFLRSSHCSSLPPSFPHPARPLHLLLLRQGLRQALGCRYLELQGLQEDRRWWCLDRVYLGRRDRPKVGLSVLVCRLGRQTPPRPPAARPCKVLPGSLACMHARPPTSMLTRLDAPPHLSRSPRANQPLPAIFNQLAARPRHLPRPGTQHDETSARTRRGLSETKRFTTSHPPPAHRLVPPSVSLAQVSCSFPLMSYLDTDFLGRAKQSQKIERLFLTFSDDRPLPERASASHTHARSSQRS